MANKKRLACLVALALAAPVAHAQQTSSSQWYDVNDAFYTGYRADYDPRWYVEPFGSYTWSNANTRSTVNPVTLTGGGGNVDGPGAGLAIGKPINRWLNLEVRASYEWLGGDANRAPGKFSNIPFGMNALIFFKRTGFQPFVIVGGGAAVERSEGGFVPGVVNPATGLPVSTSGKSDIGWMANAGVGALYPVSDNVSLRVDGGYRWQQNQANQQTFLGRENGNLGFWVVNAGVQIALGAKPLPPPPPPPAYVAPPPPPPPPAPPPAKLLPKQIDFSADALFDFDKATLRPKGQEMLDELVSTLAGANFETILAIGHTDPLGSDAYNQKLSERRAATVKQYLTSKGIASERISAVGKGETQLKITEAECKSSKGRKALIECLQPNRRVDVSVSATKPQ